jgi:hypothetical protein
MITVTYLSPRRVCRHTCSSTPMTATPSNRAGRRSGPGALGEDRVVGGVPRDGQGLGDPGDGQVLHTRSPPAPTAARAGTASPAARPPWWCPAATRARSRCTGTGDVTASVVGATRTVRAPTGGPPCRGSRPSQPHRRHHRSSCDDPAGEHGTVRLEALPGDHQPEFVEAAERGQVRASEGSVRHVEVFQISGLALPGFSPPGWLTGQDPRRQRCRRVSPRGLAVPQAMLGGAVLAGGGRCRAHSGGTGIVGPHHVGEERARGHDVPARLLRRPYDVGGEHVPVPPIRRGCGASGSRPRGCWSPRCR